MARRKQWPYDGKRYLRNNNPSHMEVHDLDNEKDGCQIDEIKIAHIEMFDTLLSALTAGYDGCAHCLPEFHTK